MRFYYAFQCTLITALIEYVTPLPLYGSTREREREKKKKINREIYIEFKNIQTQALLLVVCP